MSKHTYTHNGAEQTEAFFDSLYGAARGNGATLDSAATKSASHEALASDLPSSVQGVLEKLPEKEHGRVLDSVLYGMNVFEREHGFVPSADVLDAALSQGLIASLDPRQQGIMDSVGSSGNTGHHDVFSAQPERVIVAITSAIAEAIPFATYLPVGIGSNQAKLAIVSHLAGSLAGGYAQNEIMDGVNVGKSYLSAERRVAVTLDAERDAGTAAITVADGVAGNVKVLRGRSIVYVNGIPSAYEASAGSAANNPLSGSINLGGTDYAISGTITTATGAVALVFAPALPVGTVVEVEGYLDYEAAPDLAPEIVTNVQNYDLYAVPWRGIIRQTIDSKSQYGNELGLDLLAESMIAVRNQYSVERHYGALAKLKALAANNTQTFNFDFTNQLDQKTRAQIIGDLFAVLGLVDQQMAEDTMDHGITHIYVGKRFAALLSGLPREIFEPSGITARPGIFRLGRLYGKFEIYYTPRQIDETTTTSQLLCIGRSTQVARCPVVLGDAVPPTVLPLAFNSDMRHGAAFYTRNFTAVNPHQPSALGAALINLTGLTGF